MKRKRGQVRTKRLFPGPICMQPPNMKMFSRLQISGLKQPCIAGVEKIVEDGNSLNPLSAPAKINNSILITFQKLLLSLISFGNQYLR